MGRRRAAQPPQKLAVRRCEVHGCDDDLFACSMEGGFCPDRMVSATCTSLECLAEDVARGTELREALTRNDRHVYVAVALVVALLGLYAAQCALAPPRPFPMRYPPPSW